MTKVKMLFIHHSTGGNLIKEGNLRDLLKQGLPEIEFFDHSYNLSKTFPRLVALFTHQKGLTDKDGKYTGKDFGIVISNNSPKEYAEIFSRNENDLTLSKILEYDIIAFKNCYPTTKIESDEKLETFKKYYLNIRESLQKYTNKKFILFTPPPLRKELTKPEYAKRARQLSDWLNSPEFEKPNNIFVFNFFDLLADGEGANKNMLKREYCRFIKIDGHPNKKANEEVCRELIKFLKDLLSNT